MIRYVFLHLDGVILENILAPITRTIVERLGGNYSANLENNVFARPQMHAAQYLAKHVGSGLEPADIIRLYYAERARYETSRIIRPRARLGRLLFFLKNRGSKVVAYGGADMDYFKRHTAHVQEYFTSPAYIQTRDFRPGIREITQDIIKSAANEVLFVGGEFIMAQEARRLNVPFLAMSNGHSFSYQDREINRLDARYRIKSLAGFNEWLMSRIEEDIRGNRYWPAKNLGLESLGPVEPAAAGVTN